MLNRVIAYRLVSPGTYPVGDPPNKSTPLQHALISNRFRVAVVMQRKQIARSGWSVPSWTLAGILPDEIADNEPAQGKLIRDDEDGAHYLWSGYAFELHADSAEQYWHSLIGQEPALYVVCREEDNRELAPYLVTIDYDEAGAYVEADDKVFSGAIPPTVYEALEEFVLLHYQPKEKKVRKRKTWKKPDTGDEAFAYRPRI